MATILGDMSVAEEGIYQRLLLVEEPEAHLHPQLQELIYDYFQKQQEGQNIQIIFTSHSPTLTSKIELEQINLLYEQDHAIRCMPMAQCKAAASHSDKAHLKKYLDVTKSQMFFAGRDLSRINLSISQTENVTALPSCSIAGGQHVHE